MGLDIRIPLGLLFLVTGVILMGYGVITKGSAMYELSESVNINLLWGSIMAVFGGVSLWAGRRVKKKH